MKCRIIYSQIASLSYLKLNRDRGSGCIFDIKSEFIISKRNSNSRDECTHEEYLTDNTQNH